MSAPLGPRSALEPYKRTSVFDENTLPAALRGNIACARDRIGMRVLGLQIRPLYAGTNSEIDAVFDRCDGLVVDPNFLRNRPIAAGRVTLQFIFNAQAPDLVDQVIAGGMLLPLSGRTWHSTKQQCENFTTT